MRRAVPIAVAAVAVAVGAALLGLDAPHAAALGGGLAAVLLLVPPGRPATEDLDGGAAPDRPPGGRNDVEEVAWSMLDREGRVRDRVLERLRAVAAPGSALAAAVDPARQRAATVAELDRALRAEGEPR